MISLVSLWVPILLSAVIVFVASSVIHMAPLWHNGDYPGATPVTDTSFALLFLKRANLAKDLSSKLQFLTQIKP